MKKKLKNKWIKKKNPQKTQKHQPEKKKKKENNKGRKKRNKKGNRERKGAAEMNPKLQEAYAFLNDLALGLEQRPWREKSICATLLASFGARTLNTRRVSSENA